MSSLLLFRPSIKKKILAHVSDPNSSNHALMYIFDIKFESTKVYTWQIKKKYSEFQTLAKSLEKDVKFENLRPVPQLPEWGKQSIFSDEEKFSLLESYLQQLEKISEVCNNLHFWEFLEVSALSFDGSGSKRKEGYVYKRTGGRISNEKLCCNIGKHFKRLQKRWMIIKDNMIGYLSSHTKEILHEVLMFKGRFEVSYGVESTGFEDGVLITTTRRNFLFRAGDAISRNEWVEQINNAYENSEWRNPDVRFDSSFPQRIHNDAKWFVDGLNYYHEVMECLIHAQKEVFISDWWLSPELFLRRPNVNYPNSQLIEILGNLADKGILVCIHVYKEVSFALTLNSLHTKKALQSRNSNIKIIRHPHRSVVGGQFLWSHHEKIVCIDQDIAFIGGLDLCFGRMDTSEHKLTDTHSPFFWNGIDYSNVRNTDFSDVEYWERDIIDRNHTPRMPWHDIGLKVVGKAASDINLHFIELWNHVMTDISGDYWKEKDLLHPISDHQEMELNKYSTIVEYSTNEELKYVEVKKSFRKELSKSLIENRNLSILSNMSLYKRIDAYGLDQLIDRDDSQSINDAIYVHSNDFSKTEQSFSLIRNQTAALHLSSKSKFREEMEALDEMVFKQELESDIAQGDEAWAKNLLFPKFKKLKKTGSCSCQVVRSAGLWSLGLDKPEHSVHAAYLHLIDQANHFIYIENQFFISGTAGKPVKNQIAQALVDRIKIAASQHENFKVIVMLPLLPGFEGDIEDSSLLKVQLHWEYQTINRGVMSIMEQLSKDKNIKHPEDFISFYSLRNHAFLNGKPVTEMVYIHSKLMIVDDDIVIVGSANINDRSLLGKNDSEIAMIINDENKVDTVIGGEALKVSEFARSLRMNLFKEFSNIGDEELLSDPLSDKFTSMWITIAQNNTALYRHIFRCYPDNELHSLDFLRTFQRNAKLDEYQQLKDGFKGFLVQFPLEFLKNENLKISCFKKEFLLPEENFV